MNNQPTRETASFTDNAEGQETEATELPLVVNEDILRNTFYIQEDVELPVSTLGEFWRKIGGSDYDLI